MGNYICEVIRCNEPLVSWLSCNLSLVVMDRTEYNNKAQDLLEDGVMYKEIKTDPTNKLKNKLINLLKKIKAEGASLNTYIRRCTLQGM